MTAIDPFWIYVLGDACAPPGFAWIGCLGGINVYATYEQELGARVTLYVVRDARAAAPRPV